MKTPKVTFWLKEAGKKGSKKPVTIMANFSYNGMRLKMSTGLTIKPSNWDAKLALPKTSFADYSEYKQKLGKLETNILDFYKSCISRGIIPEPDTIKQHVQGKTSLKHESEVVDFFERYEEFILEKELKVDPKTVKKYNTLLKLLTQFVADKKYKVLFDTMDSTFETRFKHYLNFDHQQCNNTVSKYMDCLKVFLKWAYKKRYHNNSAWQDFTAPRESTKVITLEDAEVKRLMDLDLSNKPHLDRVRDKFCFQLHTAQRFEDVRLLTWKSIKYNNDGSIYWHLFQSKASKTDEIRLPIVGEAKKILERQKKGAPEELVFKNIQNQPFNRCVKEICKLAGIDDYIVYFVNRGNQRIEKAGPKHMFISSHTARRSYITLSAEKGMTELAIRGMSGHKDYRMVMKYLAMNQKHIDAEVNKHWANS